MGNKENKRQRTLGYKEFCDKKVFISLCYIGGEEREADRESPGKEMNRMAAMINGNLHNSERRYDPRKEHRLLCMRSYKLSRLKHQG